MSKSHVLSWAETLEGVGCVTRGGQPAYGMCARRKKRHPSARYTEESRDTTGALRPTKKNALQYPAAKASVEVRCQKMTYLPNPLLLALDTLASLFGLI